MELDRTQHYDLDIKNLIPVYYSAQGDLQSLTKKLSAPQSHLPRP